MDRRRRRKNRRSNNAANDIPNRSVSTSNDSSLGPLATSSPESSRTKCDDQEDAEEILNARLQAFKDNYKNNFNNFISTIDPKLLEMPFNFSLKCFDIMMKGCASDQEENDSDSDMDSKDDTVNEFKVPSLPVKKIDKSVAGTSGSSRSVHWESSVENNDPEDDVFKTPFKKKKNISVPQKTCGLVTPKGSRSNAFAVVTPGPLMQRNVRVLRVPDAGETAVSLRGSPLFVTPLGNNTGGPQVTVSLPDVGRLMTIIPPEENEVSPTSNHLFSGLEPDTKKQLQNLATFLLNNVK